MANVKFLDRHLRLVIIILATIGIVDTATITLSHWEWITSITCNSSNQDCEKALQSAWGFVFGQPLSLFGLLAYSVILFSTAISIVLPKKRTMRMHFWNRRGPFFVSLIMANFSLLLMSLLVFKIQVFCFFCLLSGTLSIALLLLNAIKIPKEEYDQLIFDSTLMSLFISTVGLIWAITVDLSSIDYSRQPIGIAPTIVRTSTSSKIALAEYLSQSDITLYSVYWCPHCHDQKELFGREAAGRLRIIECGIEGENNQHSNCLKEGITGFPSWDFKNKLSHAPLQSGIKSLNQLAELSGYMKP
ncbi:MAG TPA: vitamin K epoxide reductase family protein [Prochlorococcaceae cyanobacterium AMR_MDS_5431]|nr:vitamin K epoxide reductase family protein [Prochlorococcaceae cyanobacterium AMR_MDS_5431]